MYGIREVDGHDDDVADALADLHRLTFFDGASIPEFDQGHWWLAFFEAMPVAFAGLVPSTRVGNAGYFSRVGVLQKHCGNRLQLRLMRTMETRAKHNGWSCVVSDTTDNLASANNFIRAGYRLYQPQYPWGRIRCIGENPSCVPGRPESSVEIQCVLGRIQVALLQPEDDLSVRTGPAGNQQHISNSQQPGGRMAIGLFCFWTVGFFRRRLTYIVHQNSVNTPIVSGVPMPYTTATEHHMTLLNKVFTTGTLVKIILVLTAVVAMKAASLHYDFSWATALAAE